MDANNVISDLASYSSEDKAIRSRSFFKTGLGAYSEKDIFMGVSVPDQRLVARKYIDLSLAEVVKLLESKIHEHRLTALLILNNKYLLGSSDTKKQIAHFYYKNRANVNNWDLVDSSAKYIYGDYLKRTSSSSLFELAKSSFIWDRRIAIVSTFAWIDDGKLELTLKIADILISDPEDLIHKAVGWALREVGKKDKEVLIKYLNKNYQKLNRTTLRYSIEKFDPKLRKYYLNKNKVS